MLHFLVVDIPSPLPLGCDYCCSFPDVVVSYSFLVYSPVDTQGHASVARVGPSYHSGVDYHSV